MNRFWMQVLRMVGYKSAPGFLCSLLLVGVLVSVPATADAQETQGTDSIFWSIGKLGYEKGQRFDGGLSIHSSSFSFAMPRDTKVRRARLRILYRASSLVSDKASLGVDVNGSPLHSLFIKRDLSVQELVIDVPEAVFQAGRLDLTVHVSLPITHDRCIDATIVGDYLQLLPQTGLELVHDQPRSLRDALLLLPETVEISLPDGALTPELYSQSWALVDQLYRQGHKVVFSRLPSLGNIVIADRSSILGALAQQFPEDRPDRFDLAEKMLPGEEDTLFTVTSAGGSFIALTAPSGIGTQYLLADRWSALAGTSHLAPRPLQHPQDKGDWPVLDSETGAMAVPLGQVGLPTGARYIAQQVEWAGYISQRALPPGTRPERVNLRILTPVRDASYQAYIYLNDVLLQAVPLEATGLSQDVSVMLPRRYQQQDNYLLVMVKADEEFGDCRGIQASFPIQLGPESELIVVRDDTVPEKFSDMPRYLASANAVYIDESFLGEADSLKFLGTLSSRFPLFVNFSRVNFVPAGATTTPEGPFMAFGDLKLEGVESPVVFDEGAIRVIDNQGNSLLDVAGLKGLAVAQIVAGRDGAHGLWVRTTDENPAPELGELHLSLDDVAFVDHSGVVMTINSKAPSLARVHYPEAGGWFANLAAYRFWFLALAWLMLTLVIIYIYRKSAKHDAVDPSESDTAVGQD